MNHRDSINLKYPLFVTVFVLFSLSINSVFGQNSDDRDVVKVHCLDGSEFWRQGIVSVLQIGNDGNIFVNQKMHITSSILHRTNQSETIHLQIHITSPHPDAKMDQTKQITFDNCESVAIIDWTYTPKVPGKHKIELKVQEGGSGYSSSFIVKDENGKNLRDYIPLPLKQFEVGIKPKDVVCQVPLQMVFRRDGTPACVMQSTMVQLWDQGWVRHADDYIKFSSKELRDKFQSKIISKEDAIEISQRHLTDNRLRLNVNISDPGFTILTNLFYQQLDEPQIRTDVNPDTGLPYEPMPPWLEKFYRNPQWWTEIQKDYLGMKNDRVEQGHIIWSIGYKTCRFCIADYLEFRIDAITGEIIRKPSSDEVSDATESESIIAITNTIAGCSNMRLEQLSINEWSQRKTNRPPSITLDNNDIEQNELLEKMLDSQSNTLNFDPHNENPYLIFKEFEVNESEQIALWDWLHDKWQSQHGEGLDRGFSSMFTYDGRYYEIDFGPVC